METSILRAFLFVAAAASVAVAVEPPAAPLEHWVLVGGNGDGNNVMSGELGDLARARAAVGDGGGLWVLRDGRQWVIRDAKMLARVHALMAPVDELGRQEGAIGKKMAPLGEQQGVLGRKMGELSHDPERNQRAMEALGRQMEALGAKMEVFGKQQEALGGRMTAAVHEMQIKLAALVDEARASGLAIEVK